MADYSTARESLNQQLEHLQARYAGTGHADTTRHEWATQQHRDSIAVYVADPSMLTMFSLVENVSLGRYRYELLERLYKPCGDPPANVAASREEAEAEAEIERALAAADGGGR